MVIVKKPGCDVSTIKTLVTSIISKAEVESNVGAELSFILPHGSSNRFPYLFSQIEERKDQLKIASYGASVTTMEEVFLRLVHPQVTDPVVQEGFSKCGPRENLKNIIHY